MDCHGDGEAEGWLVACCLHKVTSSDGSNRDNFGRAVFGKRGRIPHAWDECGTEYMYLVRLKGGTSHTSHSLPSSHSAHLYSYYHSKELGIYYGLSPTKRIVELITLSNMQQFSGVGARSAAPLAGIVSADDTPLQTPTAVRSQL